MAISTVPEAKRYQSSGWLGRCMKVPITIATTPDKSISTTKMFWAVDDGSKKYPPVTRRPPNRYRSHACELLPVVPSAADLRDKIFCSIIYHLPPCCCRLLFLPLTFRQFQIAS